MVNEYGLTDLEESILVSNTIITKIDALLKGLKDYDTSENPYLLIIMKESMVLEICKYLEEYDRCLLPTLRELKMDWIIDIHRPYLECLTQNKTLRRFRNQHIAHPHRDWNGNFVLLMDTVFSSESILYTYELIFLGECLARILFLTVSRIPDTFFSAVEKYESHLKDPKYESFFKPSLEFNSLEDVEMKLEELLSECDDIFNSEYPDEETWKRKTQNQ